MFSGVYVACVNKTFSAKYFARELMRGRGDRRRRNNKTEIYARVCAATESRAFTTGPLRPSAPLPPYSHLSVHKTVTRRKFNNLYFHIRGFPLRCQHTTGASVAGIWNRDMAVWQRNGSNERLPVGRWSWNYFIMLIYAGAHYTSRVPR